MHGMQFAQWVMHARLQGMQEIENMAIYLNPGSEKLEISRRSRIYVDKSGIIGELNAFFDTEDRYVCVSRPRRFGKSMTANMISAYYDRTVDGEKVFAGLEILSSETGHPHMNSCDVIFLNMQEFLSRTDSMDDFLGRLNRFVLKELIRQYPDADYLDDADLPQSMGDIYEMTRRKFVIIIDEWDCIFREYREDHTAQKQYLDFLRNWLKDKAYIGLAYMTGILPIKKYGTHSALNMFSEYSMTNAVPLDSYMGFTSQEVQLLCSEYHISFEEVKNWYDGYDLKNIGDIYSPRSVVQVMKTGIFDDYWNQTESFEALKVYIDMNYDGLKDSVLELMAGGRISVDIRTFSNDMTTFSGYQDVLTLLIHLGYLGYDFDRKEVFIPNREVLMEFVAATRASDWSEIMNSVVQSDTLLNAVWDRDEDKVARGIERAHLETSHLQYNDENALSYTIALAFYAARQYYTVIRELPAGKGYADLAFIPRRKYPDKPAMVIELKWDRTADTAIHQILDKHYPDGLEDYKGSMLLVGISYDKKTRKHQCQIEEA